VKQVGFDNDFKLFSLMRLFMKFWIFAILLIVQSLSSFAASDEQARALAGANFKRFCAPPSPTEEYVYQDDFKWGLSLVEMKALFQKLYESPKRFINRVFWSEKEQNFIAPLEMIGGTKALVMSPLFISSLRAHLEQALKQGHADFGFFPDMGHNHFLIPQDVWDNEYSQIKIHDRNLFYQSIFADHRLKILYHTAEQLKMEDENRNLILDRYTQYRYYTRNVVGRNDGSKDLEIYYNNDPQRKFNTVGEVPGFYWWGAGVNFHSSENGCFEYKTADGKTMRFDISTSDLPIRPGQGLD
jgi:hypothetical protein